MSGQFYKNTKFKSKILDFFRKNKEILDIIIFGSAVKGKEKPNDIDVLVLFKDKKDLDISYELKKSLEKEFKLNFEIVSKSYNEVFSISFKAREAIISEGYSVVYSRYISEGFGYNAFMLFKYSLKGLNKSQRMRFYYSLYGRTKEQKGVLSVLNAKKFSESLILCPLEKINQMDGFFENWKISFESFPVLIPSRIR